MLKVRNLATCGLAVIGFVLASSGASAWAQSDATINPDQGSPAGTQYQLPLDSARGDAAPRGPREPAARSGDAPASGAQPAQDPIHSENGFGSSAKVPGVKQATPSGGSGKTTTTAAGAAETSSSGAKAGAASASVGLAGSPASDPSGTRVYGLLALGVLLAVGVAVAGRVSARH